MTTNSWNRAERGRSGSGSLCTIPHTRSRHGGYVDDGCINDFQTSTDLPSTSDSLCFSSRLQSRSLYKTTTRIHPLTCLLRYKHTVHPPYLYFPISSLAPLSLLLLRLPIMHSVSSPQYDRQIYTSNQQALPTSNTISDCGSRTAICRYQGAWLLNSYEESKLGTGIVSRTARLFRGPSLRPEAARKARPTVREPEMVMMKKMMVLQPSSSSAHIQGQCTGVASYWTH